MARYLCPNCGVPHESRDDETCPDCGVLMYDLDHVSSVGVRCARCGGEVDVSDYGSGFVPASDMLCFTCEAQSSFSGSAAFPPCDVCSREMFDASGTCPECKAAQAGESFSFGGYDESDSTYRFGGG